MPALKWISVFVLATLLGLASADIGASGVGGVNCYDLDSCADDQLGDSFCDNLANCDDSPGAQICTAAGCYVRVCIAGVGCYWQQTDPDPFPDYDQMP